MRGRSRAIDWRLACEDVPTIEFFEGMNLHEPSGVQEAIGNFIFCLEQHTFLMWEAVIRREQKLPLTKRHREALGELLDFGDPDDAENDRIKYIDDGPRPTEPWYEVLRRLTPHLAVPLPFRTADVHYEYVTTGWRSLSEALDEHAQDLSLPDDIATAAEVVPAELRHRLVLQSCFDALSGLGQEGVEPLADDDGSRVGWFVDALRAHRDTVQALGLTLGTLPQFVQLPPADEKVLLDQLAAELHIDSPVVPLATVLAKKNRRR